MKRKIKISLDVVHLPSPHHLRLLQLLHRVDLPVALVAHQTHLSEGAAPDDRQRLEVIRRNLGALQPRKLTLLLLKLLDELLTSGPSVHAYTHARARPHVHVRPRRASVSRDVQ